MSLAATLLADDALREHDGGFELDVRLNWYRSLPLSSVATLELSVDGKTVPRGEIAFVLNGSEHALDELAGRWEETWFVLDPATLRVRRPLVRRGEAVEIRIRLGSRIPYLLIAPGTPLEVVSERTRTLVAA
jgi:hypothetical protein